VLALRCGAVASTWHFLGFAVEADWVEAWGTWIGGSGTVGALFYAVKALRAEARNRQADIRQARQERRHAEDARARTVLFYDRSAEVRPGHPLRIEVTVGNFGNSPITNVQGALTHRYTNRRVGNDTFASTLAIVAGGKEGLWWDVPADALGNKPPSSNPTSLTGVLKVEMLWTDVDGIRWVLELDSGQQPKRYIYDTSFEEIEN
jgi:hypothetical protein